MDKVDRVIQYAQTDKFRNGEDLTPDHCDILEKGCLQNGDIPKLELIELARRNWPDAKQALFYVLTEGYEVFHNDAPRVM